jgi:hypothetical protein
LYYRAIVTQTAWCQPKPNVGQWNRIEDPKINPHSYIHLIINKKGTNRISCRKRQPLQQVVLGKLDLFPHVEE